MVKKIVLMAAVALLAASCDKLDLAGLLMPASADVESRVKESLALNDESGPRVVSVASDSYRVYACADVHWLDDSRHLAAFVDSLRSDSLAAVGLLIGDLAGRRGAMPAVAAALRRDPAVHPYAQPLAAVVGNHDLYFGQWEDFKECFGSSTYALTVVTPNHRNLFLMLDSGGGCHGRTQMDWLRGQLAHRAEYRHVVVCTHVNLLRTDLSQFVSGNLPLEETYELLDLLAANGVSLCLQGHDHHRDVSRYDGVEHLTLDCLEDGASNASFLVVDIAERVNWRFICNF